MSAATIAPAARVMAALRAGAHLAHRPRGVVHVYTGPLSPSGRFAAAAGRTVCGTRTRRLSKLECAEGRLDLGRRRFCRRCTRGLPPVLGQVNYMPVSRDQWAAAFAALTVDDLTLIARWARTVEETHQAGYLASVLLGPASMREPTASGPDRDRWLLEQTILRRRRQLVAAARTPEEREQAVRDQEAEALDRARVNAARREADRLDVLVDRRRRGSYLTPWERDFLASTG